ncbi:MAG: type restriction-modification system methyltransferase subunit [Acidimicrobiales bacterium]|nr:type restriction-modification system methyltransferase subunit [Acidimicrobiales bacterium]
MIDDAAKSHLHDHLRWVREALVWKLEGLSEYDVRRPMTATGTNLLGLVKHNAIWDSRYFGEVFGRPFAEDLPDWDDVPARGTDFWATEHESRADVVDLYRRVWTHTDATIDALDLGTMGHVPWWQQDVPLFNVMVHCLSDTTRHAGHADILRETLDGAVGVDRDSVHFEPRDGAFWEARRATLERIAISADRGRLT